MYIVNVKMYVLINNCLVLFVFGFINGVLFIFGNLFIGSWNV